MAAGRQVPVTDLFAGRVPDEVIAAYARLLSSGRVALDQAAELLGGQDLVDALCELGMSRVITDMPSAPPVLQATPVALALQAVLCGMQATVLRQQELLLDGYRHLAEVQALPDVASNGSAEHLVRIITDRDEIRRVSSCLINSTHRDWMTLETAETDMPLREDHRIKCPAALRGQIRMRSIFDAATLTQPAALRNLQLCIADGEEVRILPHVPMKMQLVDGTTVLLPLTPTGTGGVLLIHSATITRAMREFFELLWNQAKPVGGAEQPQGSTVTDLQRDILQLLWHGQGDATIARNLGKSESVIRRNICALNEIAGTEGRFALGAAAALRGWLPVQRKDHA